MTSFVPPKALRSDLTIRVIISVDIAHSALLTGVKEVLGLFNARKTFTCYP